MSQKVRAKERVPKEGYFVCFYEDGVENEYELVGKYNGDLWFANKTTAPSYELCIIDLSWYSGDYYYWD